MGMLLVLLDVIVAQSNRRKISFSVFFKLDCEETVTGVDLAGGAGCRRDIREASG